MFVLGNLFIGERFAEPQGKSVVSNTITGEHAELDYYRRTMFGNKPSDINKVTGTIYDSNKQATHKFEGKYTDKVNVRSMGVNDYGKVTEIFRSPGFVPTEQEPKKIYGLNMLALQLNHLPDELR